MKIGIIVHSQTEHTYSVAQKLQEKLSTAGHKVDIEQVITVGDAAHRAKNIEFESRPEVDIYEALVFGAPVQAFSLSKVMKAYLEQITSLENKKVACFVTKGLPFHRTGGNQAIDQMKKICKSKGGNILVTGIVVWRGSHEKETANLVDKFSKLF